MLFKLSVGNLRRSLRDYAVYFFTIVIGVSVFYVFNAIGDQTTFMQLGENTQFIIELIVMLMSGISVFVAIVLGLLIVYASRFLMKRRSREFALYMILGMGKGKISAILLLETLLIGIGSLAVGLLAGIGLSQLMSAVVAGLFEADMSDYRFIVSGQAIGKTILYFSIMYLLVMLFNSFLIGKAKLLDLIQSGRRAEKLRIRNPLLSALLFVLSCGMLAFAYHWLQTMIEDPSGLSIPAFSKLIALGSLATLLIFYSFSGWILFVVQKLRHVYYSGLNSFTFRQISSRISTMVVSMTIICLMLFVTICSLCSAFSMRNSLNRNLREYCPADAELVLTAPEITESVTELIQKFGYDMTEAFSSCTEYTTYTDPAFTFGSFCGEHVPDNMGTFFGASGLPETIMTVSDYNRLMALYGKEPVTLQDGRYVLLCNFRPYMAARDLVLRDDGTITVFGTTLVPQNDACVKGSVYLESQEINMGIFLVPDAVAAGQIPHEHGFAGIFRGETREEKQATEQRYEESLKAAKMRFLESGSLPEDLTLRTNTRSDIAGAAIGLGAIATFVGLYLGLVFLVSCGAILALKQLSESADSIDKYVMLRKLGVAEEEINRSMLIQSGIFFLLPLLLAILHSYFGMQFAGFVLQSMGISNMWQSVAGTAGFLLVIYGGYFVITHSCSRFVVRGQR